MTPRQPRTVIAFDGHDGAGKTTIARAVAAALDGIYVKPFDETVGDLITWLHRARRHDDVLEVARCAVDRVLALPDSPQLVVMDRCWMSLFTLLPEEMWQAWPGRVETVLCWTDVPTTLRRLEARGEPVDDLRSHTLYCGRYRVIAAHFGVPILETTSCSVDEGVRRALSLVGAMRHEDRDSPDGH